MKIFKQLIKDPDLEWLSIDGTHDVKVTPELIKNVELKETKFLNADRGYISKDFTSSLLEKGIHPSIPNRKNSLNRKSHMDWYIYKVRHVIENIFAILKHFRGLCLVEIMNVQQILFIESGYPFYLN